MTAPANEAVPPGPRLGFRGVHRSVWSLLIAVAITSVCALGAAAFGILLAGFGLPWVALIVAVAAVGVAVLVRRAVLPIAVVTTALALPAAAVTLAQLPIDRSAGLLTVTPTRASQIDGRALRRGVGSIFVDLRRLEASPGSTIRLRTVSDTGRVVVALPHDRCVNLRV